MNRLSLNCNWINNPLTPKEESQEAAKYFKTKYNNIEFLAESDSFRYRGMTFDYFKSGTKMGWNKGSEGFSGNYLLVDPQNYRNNWLFDYGEPEQMWQDFLKRCSNLIIPIPKQPNKLKRIFSILFE